MTGLNIYVFFVGLLVGELLATIAAHEKESPLFQLIHHQWSYAQDARGFFQAEVILQDGVSGILKMYEHVEYSGGVHSTNPANLTQYQVPLVSGAHQGVYEQSWWKWGKQHVSTQLTFYKAPRENKNLALLFTLSKPYLLLYMKTNIQIPAFSHAASHTEPYPGQVEVLEAPPSELYIEDGRPETLTLKLKAPVEIDKAWLTLYKIKSADDNNNDEVYAPIVLPVQSAFSPETSITTFTLTIPLETEVNDEDLVGRYSANVYLRDANEYITLYVFIIYRSVSHMESELFLSMQPCDYSRYRNTETELGVSFVAHRPNCVCCYTYSWPQSEVSIWKKDRRLTEDSMSMNQGWWELRYDDRNLMACLVVHDAHQDVVGKYSCRATAGEWSTRRDFTVRLDTE